MLIPGNAYDIAKLFNIFQINKVTGLVELYVSNVNC